MLFEHEQKTKTQRKNNIFFKIFTDKALILQGLFFAKQIAGGIGVFAHGRWHWVNTTSDDYQKMTVLGNLIN